MLFTPFTDEQARTLVNLEQHYSVWIDAARARDALPYNLQRKEISGRSYLYEIRDRRGNGRSLGPWSEAAAEQLAEYQAQKTDAKERLERSAARLRETGRLARAVRAPMIASAAGPIIREADRRKLLGSHLLIVGTTALAAYAIEAGGVIHDAPAETDDFDMAWSATKPAEEKPIWDLLKAVDSTFTMNFERTFQARNADAYEVEILVAPSRAKTMSKLDQPRPVPLPEQEWLLLGRPVDRVVLCRDGSAARIVAPDPRYFALQKLWMGRQAKRNALKRPKDLKQGGALLNAVRAYMPHYPLDEAFIRTLPAELAPRYRAWEKSSA